MEPLVRQTALEILLSHTQDLSAEQLNEALRLGMDDADFNINEKAWKFIKKNDLTMQFLRELFFMAQKLSQQKDEYCRKLALAVFKDLKSLKRPSPAPKRKS